MSSKVSSDLDIIVHSAELKRLIVERWKKLNVSLRLIVEEQGVDWVKFKSHYLNSIHIKKTKEINQALILTIAMKLGINVKVSIFMKPIEELELSDYRYGKNEHLIEGYDYEDAQPGKE